MVESFAGKLQNREPAELLDEVRSFARRKPGLFLLGAAAAGVVAGRLTRGVHGRAQRLRPVGTGTTGYRAQTNYVDPTPTYVDDHQHLHGHRDAGLLHRRLRPAPAAAVRHGAARGQRRPAGGPGRLGRPGSASRRGGLSDELPLLRRHPGGLDPEHPGGRLHRPGAAELRR